MPILESSKKIPQGVFQMLQQHLGKTVTDDQGKTITDRSSVQFYDQLVQAWFEYRNRFKDNWEFVDTEYRIGLKTRSNDYFHPERYHGDGTLGTQPIFPARIYSLVHITEAQVMGNRPKMFLQGFTAQVNEDVRNSLETALNNEWQQDFDLYRQSRLCVRDCVKKGFGVMLSSYDDGGSAGGSAGAAERRKQQADDPVLGEARRLVETNLAAQAQRGPAPTSKENFEGNRVGKIVSRRISPDAFLFDPDATSEQDAKWMGRMVVADLEMVRQDPTYENTEDLSATTRTFISEATLREMPEGVEEGPYELVLLYEMFIKQEGGHWDLVVFAHGGSLPLRVEEKAYWIGCPYKVLRWNDDGEEFIPISDAQAVMSEVLAERSLLTKLFEGYAREHADTYLFDENAGISEEDLNAINNQAVSKWVPVTKSSNRRLSDLVFKMPKDTKSPDALNILAALERGIQISSGIGPNQFGQALKSSTSATEANEVANFSRARGSHKLAAVEEFISRIASDRLGLMAEYYDREDIMRLVSPEAAENWPDWTEGDVQEGLRVMVDPGSTTQESEQNRVNQLITLLGVVNQDPAMRQLFDIPALSKELFEKMGFREGSKFLLLNSEQFAETALQNDAAALVAGGQGGPGGSAAGVPGGTAPQQDAGGAQ